MSSHRCYGLKAESHMNWTHRRASPSFQGTRSHVSSSHSPLSPTTVVSWHLFLNYPQPSALILWPSGLRDSLPSRPHLQTPAAPWRLGLFSCFPTFLSTHLQRKGFLWAVTFLTHLFSWQWWWAARLLQRRPTLWPRAFQTAVHKQHGEALCNTKQHEYWYY